MKTTIYIVLICLSVLACTNTKTNEQTKGATQNIYGCYVDDNYSKRTEGYDWVAVSVKKHTDKTIDISVRSRADKKRPTCTFDIIAKQITETSYEALYDSIGITFKFSKNSIKITSKQPKDMDRLSFFCNGGATVAGDYKKTEEQLDCLQIDKTKYFKTLQLQSIYFNVSSIEKNNKNTLTVSAFGLKTQNYHETFNIEGQTIINAEVEDLNSDGSPELLIYTLSNGSGAYGNVYAFSVNNRKSMSQVYFQPTSENPKINQGYMGHDEFTIIENILAQRFPVYKEGDTNANPTGGTRQISYKLVEGEAIRKLVVDKITTF